MSKCLVTGGAGFIGSTLVDELIKKGHQAIVIDNLSTGKKDNLNKDAKFIEADIRDFEKILPYFKGVDFVFHLAALVSVQTSIDNPLHNNAVNLSGTLNVLEAARLSKVKKLVFSSSAAIYGDTETYPTKETDESKPVSPYAVQKLAGEKYCELYSKIFNLPTVNLRYFNIFGDRMALNGGYALVLGIFANQKLNKEVLTITSDGEQRRDFIS
ncbi:MAG: NAD-dependent epimerase/dehydratase family protein, partial [Candidatus Falkowbacteria bacterium]|nr:NAD-dependent epimerase/dehydratase family protein [Candidatus Falkowbacteria bacterium]